MESSSEIQAQNFALLTLKERCHFLKEQLRAVDEENIKLKVQIATGSVKSDSVSSTNMLVEQVETLKKQNNQLSNQMHILATENSNMWSRLSRLTLINRGLYRRFSKISDTLEKHGLGISISDSDPDSTVTIDGRISRKDIEDFSLKLINGIKLEKTELESQYAQMVALHEGNENSTALNPDLAFGSVDFDEENVIGAVRKHAQKMNNLKGVLIQQQQLLINAVEDLKRLKSEQTIGSTRSNVVSKDVFTETNDDLSDNVCLPANRPVLGVEATEISITNGDAEPICPLCSKHIPSGVKDLADHIGAHFDGEQDSIVNVS